MPSAPPDLSACQECGRRVPPSNSLEFPDWLVTKNERGRVRGMMCPACQAKAAAEDDSSATG